VPLVRLVPPDPENSVTVWIDDDVFAHTPALRLRIGAVPADIVTDWPIPITDLAIEGSLITSKTRIPRAAAVPAAATRMPFVFVLLAGAPLPSAAAPRLIAQARWCNLVVSNIPAPQVPLYLAGAPLEASYPAMNLKEDCGLSVACTSAAGTMAFGLTADWDRVPDLDVLARGIESAIDDLAEAVRS
jgi:hypothetical protein